MFNRSKYTYVDLPDTAGAFFFSLLADAEDGSIHLAGEKIFFHLPCALFPFIAMPILILGGSHFGTQARRPYLGALECSFKIILSFRKRQARSMTWVPALTVIFFLLPGIR